MCSSTGLRHCVSRFEGLCSNSATSRRCAQCWLHFGLYHVCDHTCSVLLVATTGSYFIQSNCWGWGGAVVFVCVVIFNLLNSLASSVTAVGDQVISDQCCCKRSPSVLWSLLQAPEATWRAPSQMKPVVACWEALTCSQSCRLVSARCCPCPPSSSASFWIVAGNGCSWEAGGHNSLKTAFYKLESFSSICSSGEKGLNIPAVAWRCRGRAAWPLCSC